MKPTWAAPIWVDADFLYMELPSPVAGAPSTTVKFINDPVGLAQALRVLGARQRDFDLATVGTKAAPTQRQVDVGRLRPKSTPRPPIATNPALKAAASALLKRMGMI